MRLPLWFLKIAFHLLYYEMAWSYDVVAWTVSFGQWAAWRRLALPFLNPGSTLELAYGTGGFFVDLLEAGHRPVGVDLSPYMARLAGNRLRHKQYHLRLNRAKVQALPFPANTFDNVVATFPTDYMLEKETLAEIHRVLKSDGALPGRLVIVAEGELRGPWPLRSIIDWLYRVTEQRSMPPARPLALLEAQAFAARWERVEHKGAIARLLVGDKR